MVKSVSRGVIRATPMSIFFSRARATASSIERSTRGPAVTKGAAPCAGAGGCARHQRLARIAQPRKALLPDLLDCGGLLIGHAQLRTQLGVDPPLGRARPILGRLAALIVLVGRPGRLAAVGPIRLTLLTEAAIAWPGRAPHGGEEKQQREYPPHMPGHVS